VKVNNIIITKNGFVLDKIDAVVEVILSSPKPLKLSPENIPLDILYEDDEVLLIDKPAGMVMHPSAGHQNGTIVHAVLGHSKFTDGIDEKLRPGIVHRLDKNTSGVVIIAKNEKTHEWLQNQFKSRKVKKVYVALVDKHPSTDSGKIVAPIYRDRSHRKKMAIAPQGKGKEAETIYRTIKKMGRFSLLEVQPLTGRTHQIRVHLASIGSPVTGDIVYGFSTPTISIKRHFLHAKSLEIQLPREKKARTFNAELPDELKAIINELEKKEK
jgi:23S rRNA pseudouridine1911/1915/1917 synthase